MTEVLKIASWNINSVRIRLEQLTRWLQRHNIDIVLLQEIKCINEQFPEEALSDLGYNCYIHGQKSYNGVAILSKIPVDEVLTTFPDNPCSHESRFIEIRGDFPVLGYSRIISVYVPNGGEAFGEKFPLKMKFLDYLKNYYDDRNFDEKLVAGGDYNVAPEKIDVYSPETLRNSTCFTDIERAKIRAIINSGMVDPQRLIDSTSGSYSWWDYRGGSFQHDKGLRIDYFLTSSNCSEFLTGCFCDKEERAKEKSSDHAPVIVEFRK